MSAEPKYHDKEWLREEYVEKGRSTLDIADECSCISKTVSRWLNRHDIETRPAQQVADERLTDSDWLREQYFDEWKTSVEIANECGCSKRTVLNWFDRHGIEISHSEGSAPDKRLTDREWLHEQYHVEHRRTGSIADECGCHRATVRRWLKRHGIKNREEPLSGDKHWFWNGGADSYGRGWNKKKRRAVRDRDDHTCQDPRCSVTQSEHVDEHGEKLHVHHLRKARDVDNPELRNAKENLITLCRNCHQKWEKIADTGLVPEVER
jgi:uncharacterized protein YjcR